MLCFWEGRPLTALSAEELRVALEQAMAELRIERDRAMRLSIDNMYLLDDLHRLAKPIEVFF